MALNRLTTHPKHPPSYCEDLESIFYVMCLLFTIYDGACYTPRDRSMDAYDETAVGRWDGGVIAVQSPPYDKIYEIKRTSVLHLDTFVLDEIAPFFEGFKDCLRRVHDLLFCPDPYSFAGRARSGEKKAALEKRYENCKPEELEDIKLCFAKELHIWDRPPALVFESFLEAFEKTFEELGKEKGPENEEKVAHVEPEPPQKLEETALAPLNDNPIVDGANDMKNEVVEEQETIRSDSDTGRSTNSFSIELSEEEG